MKKFIIIALLFINNAFAAEFVVKVRYVHDGDTIMITLPKMPAPLDKASVRLLGIDTPEMAGKCLEENKKAIEAKAMLIKLIGNSKTIILTDFKYDKYGGRIDANVIVNSKNLSQELIKAGLARPYYGEAKQTWCQ